MKNQFISSFTASRRHPKTEAALEAIIQRHDETLREFINRFNREAIQVPCADHMKRYLLERGLLPGTEFRKAVGIEPPATFDALLDKARAYMDYEEREAANRARDSRARNHGSSSRQDPPPRRTGEKRKEDRPREVREQRGPSGRFTEYTPLTASRERILAE